MSGRRRKSESLWARKEDVVPENETREFDLSFPGGGSPKWSNLDADGVLMSDDYSRQPSRELMQANENMHMDNDRDRMKTDPAFDEWANQYDSHPLDNRGGDRGISVPGSMSKDRERGRSRSFSPHRSRGRDRDRDRGSTRALARSRSWSRDRDQGRARSPSRGRANRLDDDYSSVSRSRDDRNSGDRTRTKGSDGYKKDTAPYDDYQKSNRSAFDDQDHRRQSSQAIKPSCKFFMMGRCNRDNCKFSHDPTESGSYEVRSGRSRGWDRDRDRGSTRALSRSRSWSRDRDQGRARSPSRGRANRLDDDYSSVSRSRDDRNSGDRTRTKGSDGYKKDTAPYDDYQKSNRSAFDDQDHRRQSSQAIKQSWKFFMMGRCNRDNGKFSHDPTESGSYEGRSHDNIQIHNSGNNNSWSEQPQERVSASGFSDVPNFNPSFDDKNSSWNDPSWNNLDLGGFDEMSRDMDMASNQESKLIHDGFGVYKSDGHQMASGVTSQQALSYREPFTQIIQSTASQFASNANGNGPQLQLTGSVEDTFLNVGIQNQTDIQSKEGGTSLETSKNNIPQVTDETTSNTEQVPQKAQNLTLADALGLLYSLPDSASMTVNEPVKTSVPQNLMSAEPVGEPKVSEERKAEDPGKSKAAGKLEEGNIGNDEKAMRQFKIALVEFVKEILKPTWKEGKMSREVYKNIVKKVVEKVTSTVQGVQIPRTQEKVDHYLAFSKSKITKLVEAYLGRFQKA